MTAKKARLKKDLSKCNWTALISGQVQVRDRDPRALCDFFSSNITSPEKHRCHFLQEKKLRASLPTSTWGELYNIRILLWLMLKAKEKIIMIIRDTSKTIMALTQGTCVRYDRVPRAYKLRLEWYNTLKFLDHVNHYHFLGHPTDNGETT